MILLTDQSTNCFTINLAISKSKDKHNKQSWVLAKFGK